MHTNHRNLAAFINFLFLLCLFCSGADLEAQTPKPTRAVPSKVPSKSSEAVDPSDVKLRNYQLKHTKAAEVLKLWQQLNGGDVNGATIDQRTNSIVFLANEAAARDTIEALALLDSEAPSPIFPPTPTPVVQGSSPQAPVPAKSKPAGPLRKFTFKHAKIADVLKILGELTGSNDDNMEGFVVDERTNSVIWKVRDEWESRHWEETLSTLDGESPVSTSKLEKTPSPYRQTEIRSDGVSLSFQTITFSMEADRSNTVESLKQRYNELEQQTHQLANKLKQSQSLSEAQRTELQLAVRNSFDARQTLQRAELADLARRMNSMQQSIDMRDKLAEKIVQKRVDDLMNPDLKWDAGPLSGPTLAGPNKGSSISLVPLPLSLAPSVTSVPYVPGEQPETVIRKRIQGRWIAQVCTQGDSNELAQWNEPLEIHIEGNTMMYMVGKENLTGPILLSECRDTRLSQISENGPLPIDFVYDPNGDPQTYLGIIACNGETLSICMATDNANDNKSFRPALFVAGSKVSMLQCRRAEPDPAKASGLNPSELSTPQATLDYLHSYSLAHPKEFPAECYTDEALLEMSGVMLQQLSMMSMLSQISMQSGGVIGEKDGTPIVSGSGPSFHLQVNALLKEHKLAMPPEVSQKAFELLVKLTLRSVPSAEVSSVQLEPSLVQPDRELIRLAAGILKSPKDFLPAAGELMHSFDTDPSDEIASKEEPTKKPKYEITIDGDNATAREITGEQAPDTDSAFPNTFKLRRIENRWLVSQVFSDEGLALLMSSMSQVFAVMNEGAASESKAPNSTQNKIPKLKEDHANAPGDDSALWDFLASYPVPAQIDESNASKVIAFVGINYLGKIEVGDFKEELREQIANYIPFASQHLPLDFELVSRRIVDVAMSETRLKIGDLAQDNSRYVQNRQRLMEQLKRHDVKVDAILIASLEHLGDSDSTSQNQFALTLEGYVNANTSWLERVNIERKSKEQSREKQTEKSPEWNDFLKLLPESGTALVMFSYEPEVKEQMLPVAKKVAEAASAQFIELPLTNWRKILSPEATHFLLMKDRQLVGSRKGLMTEARLQDFVSKANDWFTPRSTGVDENSLVRIDCFISPGTDNIGSQHGGAYPLTMAVVAVHEDQALLFGPDSIAKYIEEGFACVAVVRDAAGKEKQVPLDVVLKGPVKLLTPSNKAKKSVATASLSFGDATSSEIPLPFLNNIYPQSFTEPLEAHELDTAIYQIRSVQGLTAVKLAAVDDSPKVEDHVLSGSFSRDRQTPPIHGFRPSIHWQSQTVPKDGGHIYGGNINGAELFEVLCPTRPAPCGFTFNARGRLIGKYGLGDPSQKDMTHTVFPPYATHSILQAALEKIDDAGLKAALLQTLGESTASQANGQKIPAAKDGAGSIGPQSPIAATSSFESPTALLSAVDECGKNGSYEELVGRFTNESIHDLAGSLLIASLQMTGSIDLAKQQGANTGAAVDVGVLAVNEVLKRWITKETFAEQQKAMGDGLSSMFGGIGAN